MKGLGERVKGLGERVKGVGERESKWDGRNGDAKGLRESMK